MKCINTANQVFESGDSCSESFTAIMEGNSIISVSIAAQEICVLQQCKNRLTSFLNYLVACDGLDDNNVRFNCISYVVV